VHRKGDAYFIKCFLPETNMDVYCELINRLNKENKYSFMLQEKLKNKKATRRRRQKPFKKPILRQHDSQRKFKASIPPWSYESDDF
jgi:hypothetical protein